MLLSLPPPPATVMPRVGLSWPGSRLARVDSLRCSLGWLWPWPRAAPRAEAVGDVLGEVAGFDAKARGEAFGAGSDAHAAVFQQRAELFCDALPAGFVGRRARELDGEDDAMIVGEDVEDAHALWRCKAAGGFVRGMVGRVGAGLAALGIEGGEARGESSVARGFGLGDGFDPAFEQRRAAYAVVQAEVDVFARRRAFGAFDPVGSVRECARVAGRCFGGVARRLR